MQSRRNLGYLVLIVAAVTMPSALSLSWYAITKNPALRPLGITRESLRSYAAAVGGFGEVEIVAQVEWAPPHTGGFTAKGLETALINSFASKGMEARVVFYPGKDKTQVTYRVGTSTIGPIPVSRASEGVQAAVEAFRMYPAPQAD